MDVADLCGKTGLVDGEGSELILSFDETRFSDQKQSLHRVEEEETIKCSVIFFSFGCSCVLRDRLAKFSVNRIGIKEETLEQQEYWLISPGVLPDGSDLGEFEAVEGEHVWLFTIAFRISILTVRKWRNLNATADFRSEKFLSILTFC